MPAYSYVIKLMAPDGEVHVTGDVYDAANEREAEAFALLDAWRRAGLDPHQAPAISVSMMRTGG